MNGFNEVDEVPMETALNINSDSQSNVMTSMLSRNIDIRSGNLTVRDGNGNSISLGVMDDNTLGLQIKDNSGYALFTLNGSTWKWNDKVNLKNVMQVGKLPDSTYGWAVAKQGYNVSDIFT